jgi:hypothetical protein
MPVFSPQEERDQMKRVCTKCKNHIAKHHRWRTVHHAISIFGWTLFRWDTQQHRNCEHPTEIHKYVKRLKGEVPLPFEEPEEMDFFDKERFQKKLTESMRDIN